MAILSGFDEPGMPPYAVLRSEVHNRPGGRADSHGEGFFSGSPSYAMNVTQTENLESGDAELVRRMLTGDERAFSEFFNGHFNRLFRFALLRVRGDEEAAEEIVQSALVKAVRKLETFRGEAQLFTWLCTFCRHEISAHFERLRRQPGELRMMNLPPLDVDQALALLETPPEQSPEAVFRRKETAGIVHEALDQLPTRYGDALEWKYVEGASVREIAGRLQLGAKATESLLTRARAAFREVFTAISATHPRIQGDALAEDRGHR